MFKLGLKLIGCLLLSVAPAVVALEDPTRPPALLKSMAAEQRSLALVPSLNSILVGPKRRLAVIDGQVLSEGERHKAMLLLRIDKDAVVVRLDGGTEHILTLDGDKVHKEIK